MPLIRSVDIQIDRVVVTTSNGNTKTFLYTQIPQSVRNQGAAAIEAWIVAFADDPANDICFDPALPTVRRFYVYPHVTSLDPLYILITVSNVPLPATWWAPTGSVFGGN